MDKEKKCLSHNSVLGEKSTSLHLGGSSLYAATWCSLQQAVAGGDQVSRKMHFSLALSSYTSGHYLDIV